MSVRILRTRVMFRSLGFVGLMSLMLGGGAWAQAVATPQAAPQATPQAVAPTMAATPMVQVTGTKVHGTITDPDGELIPGASVTLTPAQGQGVTVKTGADGTYSVTVPAGSYTVLVTMPGFASYSAINMKIPAVVSTTLDAKLSIGVQSQVVTVEANAVQLSVDPDSNQSSTVLTGKDLDALSDDPDELSSELTALAGPSAGPNGGQIYVDGFTGGQLPPKSSIREIRINQNPFSAQYDQLGFGRIEVFTKPGTDKIHGNFQVNGNPSQFNSSDPLSAVAEPPYHTLFMFGNLTGPLNKSASYNVGGSYRQIQSDEVTDAQIPVASLTVAAAGTPAICAPGDATCVLTPYQVSTYFPQLRGDINPRLDVALGSKNVLTMRYQFVKSTATNDGIGNYVLPSDGFNQSSTSNIIQLSDTENFSTRLINETHFEYEREHEATTALNNTPLVTLSGDFTDGGYSAQNLSDHQDHYEVQNYTSLQLKKNFIRFGGRLRATREAENTENNTNGTFIYGSFAGYQAGTPTQFAITQINNHKIGDTLTDLGMYAETDWKARQNLTVSYGFRYETQNHLGDHHDIAPRVAFNYGLFSGKGAPKTVLRGGFGLFYTRFSQGNELNLQQENGTNETIYTKDNPGVGCTPAAAASGGGTVAENLIAACGATASSQTTYTAAPNLRTPYIVQFAGGADQSVGKHGTISVNYLHSQGTHQFASQNIGYNFSNPSLTLPTYQYYSEGEFKQNQLIINGRVQTGKRVSLFGFYSLNSAHGDTSGSNSFPTTPGDLAADYGRTTFDVKSRLFLGGSIVLPKLIQFSPFMIAQSGNPYNVTTGSDNNDDTILNDRPYVVPNGYTSPIAVGPGETPVVQSIAGCGTFAQPGYQPAGATIAPINDCTGPALFTFNFRLTKTIGFGASTAVKSDGGPGGGPGGGPPGGGRGGHDGGGHGGGPGFGGGGVSSGRRYNVAFGLQVQNLFNNEDLSTPVGVLSSENFGKSTQLNGGPYTTSNALRRISLQASFQF
jgi:hypothetical protein